MKKEEILKQLEDEPFFDVIMGLSDWGEVTVHFKNGKPAYLKATLIKNL